MGVPVTHDVPVLPQAEFLDGIAGRIARGNACLPEEQHRRGREVFTVSGTGPKKEIFQRGGGDRPVGLKQRIPEALPEVVADDLECLSG